MITKRVGGLLVGLCLIAMCLSTAASATVDTSFLYSLSDFNGPITKLNWASIFTDEASDEVYVLNRSKRSIKVFNKHGMELYSFGQDATLGSVRDGTVHPDGDIFLLSYDYESDTTRVIRCNYRGEPKSTIEFQNFPADFEGLKPTRIDYLHGQLYFIDKREMKILVTDEEGVFKRGLDLRIALEITEEEREDTGVSGYSVAKDGGILFTVRAHFSAYKLYPNGRLIAFGQEGQSPGKFGVVGGITVDDHGNYLVTDTLRCVVLIFDSNFKFQKEFGYRGRMPHNLVAPMDLAFLDDRLYVAQRGKQGVVSVFRFTYPTIDEDNENDEPKKEVV